MDCKRIRNLETEKYVLFYTNEFSQWHRCAFTSQAGQKFASAEQYMMHGKAMLFGDAETAQKILATEDPEQQKALGRTVKGFDKAVWEAHARELVYEANHYKFTQNPKLWAMMKKTAGKRLVEAAANDTIWGIGLEAGDPRALDEKTWLGTNFLGDVLTRLRDDLLAAGFEPAAKSELTPVSKPSAPKFS